MRGASGGACGRCSTAAASSASSTWSCSFISTCSRRRKRAPACRRPPPSAPRDRPSAPSPASRTTCATSGSGAASRPRSKTCATACARSVRPRDSPSPSSSPSPWPSGSTPRYLRIAYALLLRPLPFDAPEQLVVLHHGTGSPGRSDVLGRRARGLPQDSRSRHAGRAAHDVVHPAVPTGPARRSPAGARVDGVVSPNYFPMLGVRAELGRLLDRGRRSRRGAGGAAAHARLLAARLPRRSLGGRTRLRDERSAAHRRRRARAIPAVRAGGRRLHADVRVPVPIEPGDDRQRRARMGQAVGRAADGVSLESLQAKPGACRCPPRAARTRHLRGPGRTLRRHGVAARRGNAPGAAPDAAAPGGRGGAGAAHRLRQRRQPDADALHAALARAAAALRARRHAKAHWRRSCWRRTYQPSAPACCWACCSHSSR